MTNELLLARYRDIIASMPPIMELKKEELLIDALHVQSLAPLELYYAPHNDVVFQDARLVIAGLTPGFQQMQLALAEAQAAIQAGESDAAACYRAKRKARFAGPMRSNLIAMLDQLGVHKWLELDSSSSLFNEQAHLLNTTSIIPYPAFYKGRNYSGSQPSLLKHQPLCSYVQAHMRRQLQLLPNVPIIPLGRSVEGMMRLLVEQGLLAEELVLWGFPHPSGANGHRHQQFAEMRHSMSRQVEKWMSLIE